MRRDSGRGRRQRSAGEQVTLSRSARVGHRAARFYDSDRSLARIVAEFLQEGFADGNPGIVVATANQRAEIIRELTDHSFDVVELQRARDLVLLDAEEILSTFMMDGKPDTGRFRDQMRHVIDRLSRGRTKPTVRIFGQMHDVLWRKGERDAAVRLEVLWNQFAQTDAYSLLCEYAIGNFYKDASSEVICGRKTPIVSANGEMNHVASAAYDSHRPRLERRGRRR
jgi:hypothetical protein